MNFSNFGQWGLVFIAYFGTSQNDLFSVELAMQVRYTYGCGSQLHESFFCKYVGAWHLTEHSGFSAGPIGFRGLLYSLIISMFDLLKEGLLHVHLNSDANLCYDFVWYASSQESWHGEVASHFRVIDILCKLWEQLCCLLFTHECCESLKVYYLARRLSTETQIQLWSIVDWRI